MEEKPKYVFFGTPKFAAVILQRLADAGLPPTTVVCNPDRPTGRKKTITPPPVKLRILNLESRVKDKIKILQPEKLDEGFKFQISDFKPGFAVVAAYAKIIPKEIIDIFPLGILGVHPSLLPKYRGATPIQSALLAGEEETGVTIYLLDEKVDHGPILAQKKFKIQSSRFKVLSEKLAELGGDLLVEILPEFVKNGLKPIPQDEKQATYTKKFSAEDAFVKFEDLENAQKLGGEIALKAERKIRALNPEPGVWTLKEGKRVKLLEAELAAGKLKLKKIQIEGGQPKVPDSKF